MCELSPIANGVEGSLSVDRDQNPQTYCHETKSNGSEGKEKLVIATLG